MRDFNFVIPSCISLHCHYCSQSNTFLGCGHGVWGVEGMILLNPLFINTMTVIQINAKQFFKYKDCVFESLSIMMDSCPNQFTRFSIQKGCYETILVYCKYHFEASTDLDNEMTICIVKGYLLSIFSAIIYYVRFRYCFKLHECLISVNA